MIRRAGVTDAPSILAMGARFFASTHYTSFASYDEDSALALIEAMTESGVLLVAEHEGVLVGCVGLMVVPFLFDQSKKVAAEVLWYVTPEAQGAGLGKALLAAVEPACRDSGAVAIQMIHLESSPPQAGALYERAGYALKEHSYMKGLS